MVETLQVVKGTHGVCVPASGAQVAASVRKHISTQLCVKEKEGCTHIASWNLLDCNFLCIFAVNYVNYKNQHFNHFQAYLVQCI